MEKYREKYKNYEKCLVIFKQQPTTVTPATLYPCSTRKANKMIEIFHKSTENTKKNKFFRFV